MVAMVDVMDRFACVVDRLRIQIGVLNMLHCLWSELVFVCIFNELGCFCYLTVSLVQRGVSRGEHRSIDARGKLQLLVLGPAFNLFLTCDFTFLRPLIF